MQNQTISGNHVFHVLCDSTHVCSLRASTLCFCCLILSSRWINWFFFCCRIKAGLSASWAEISFSSSTYSSMVDLSITPCNKIILQKIILWTLTKLELGQDTYIIIIIVSLWRCRSNYCHGFVRCWHWLLLLCKLLLIYRIQLLELVQLIQLVPTLLILKLLDHAVYLYSMIIITIFLPDWKEHSDCHEPTDSHDSGCNPS